ncbi:MAG: hypothetical protein QNK37_37795 [Acidobacteriota bacterium]|nr:hypothetical protein [Acidobacteriota bacterium]
MKRASLLFAVLFAAALFAGGPNGRNINGTPYRQDLTQPLTYNIDQGNLNARYDQAAARTFINEEFNDWGSIPGSQLVIQEGEPLSVDVTSIDEIQDAIDQGLSPIVLDETDSVAEDFGLAGTGVLAFASAWPPDPADGFYDQMFAVIGGPGSANVPENSIRSTILHELGHGFGLDHTAVVGHMVVDNIDYEDFGEPPGATAEIMYWLALGTGTSTPKQDDISGYLALYGNETGNDQSGAISGRIYMPDGASGANGVNVIVRDRSGGGTTVFTNAASLISYGSEGRYEIVGLPPGEYSVEVHDLGTTGNGGAVGSLPRYDAAVRSNFPDELADGNNILGPFPGDVEFFDAGESNRPEVDDPANMTLVTVTAGNTATGIDIIFNHPEGVKGTTLNRIYHIPEVQVGGDNATHIGIVNTSGNSRRAEVSGFAADGTQIVVSPNLVTVPANGKVNVDVSDWFGSRAGEVDWIQVGGSGDLLVYGELQTATTRASWWANDGFTQNAFLPHVAQDTATFETVLASVNGTDAALTSNLISQPGAANAPLDGHGSGFGQERNDLLSLFGDLSTVEWARLESDGEATASMEYFVGPLDTRSRMAALGLTDESGNRLRFLHIASDTDRFWTGLVYINTSDTAVTATETYYNNAGAVLATVEEPLDPGEKITRVLLKGLDPAAGGVPEGSAWMEVTIPDESGGQLVGYELFSSPDPQVHDIFTGLQGNYSEGAVLTYPHFQGGSTNYTAIVATNVGDEVGDLTVDLMNTAGVTIASTTLTDIAPGEKRAALITAAFFGVDSVEAGAWLRATSTASAWAGFELWGDFAQEGQPPQFLSGINAAISGTNAGGGGGIPERTIIQETDEVHNSYETAQELTPVGGGWNLNVVGTIEQDGAGGPVVNIPYGDGIEDIYTFTLNEATPLLIAANPDNPAADIDLMVVQGVSTRTDFFPDNPEYLDDIDWSASGGGLESVARVFQPGTYYILVSLFEGDTFATSDYGLLVTSYPLTLETFETADVLDGFNYLGGVADSDGLHNWTWTDVLSGFKFGPSLVQIGPEIGQTESTLALAPFIDVPETGVTVFDFDFAAVGNEIGGSDGILVGIADEEFTVSTTEGVTYGVFTQPNIVDINGTNVSIFPFLRWGASFSEAGTFQANYTFSQEQLGQRLAMGIFGVTSVQSWVVDNLRIYNMVTTPNAKAKAKPARLMVPRKGVKKPKRAVPAQVIETPTGPVPAKR